MMNDLSLWEEEENITDEESESIVGSEGDENLTLWAEEESDLPPLADLLFDDDLRIDPYLPDSDSIDRYPGDDDYGKATFLYQQFYTDPASIVADGAAARSLRGAWLYASPNPAKQWEGAELIREAAQERDGIAMRERAVVLLEGLVCERDPDAALKWLLMAARAGDLKALRILVYAIYGAERLLVVPRPDAKPGDPPGRSITLSDLFKDVELSDAERVNYLRHLIDLEQQSIRVLDGKAAIRGMHLDHHRRFLTLLFAYIRQVRQTDPEYLLDGRFLNRWEKPLRAAIGINPLIDGILIRERETSEEQLKLLDDLRQKIEQKKREAEEEAEKEAAKEKAKVEEEALKKKKKSVIDPKKAAAFRDLLKYHYGSDARQEMKMAMAELTDRFCRYYNAEELEELKNEAEADTFPKEASYLLGLRYERGLGTATDWKAAAECFRNGLDGLYDKKCKAHLALIEQDAEKLEDLKNSLALLHTPQAALGAERIDALVQKRFAPAMVTVAMQKLEIDQQIRIRNYYALDPKEGLKLLERAADQGNRTALGELERFYRHGIIVDQDVYTADSYMNKQRELNREELMIDE
ncbi:MAG: hypothetical protein K6G16_10290 [Lachnospiraceae bacterium]|nr:hypothetical protein [Lachnospiraceae bacterium]